MKKKQQDRIPRDYESKMAAFIVSAICLVVIFLGLFINAHLK